MAGHVRSYVYRGAHINQEKCQLHVRRLERARAELTVYLVGTHNILCTFFADVRINMALCGRTSELPDPTQTHTQTLALSPPYRENSDDINLPSHILHACVAGFATQSFRADAHATKWARYES